MKRSLFTGIVIACLASAASGADLPAAADRPIDFARDVRPIFAQACASCHGAAKQRGGLRLDAAAAAMRGGDRGPAITPGDAAYSRLLLAVSGLDPDLKMPPAGKPQLTAEQIGVLRAWIDQGAKWPKDETVAGPAAAHSDHWAFQPPKRGTPPDVTDKDWCRNDIDRFVLARLDQEKIAPSPEADRVTLIRRLSLDLLGLPPSPKEVDAFVADQAPDAYEKLVDRLLASPAYGERWGRHWLDLARYADSDGYEKDTGRPYAWRYRQWVIEALNRNLPYDEFVVEQLAGDLLPNATLDQKIATGFHRNTLSNHEGGVDQEQFRVEACVDRVNTTAEVFMGLTLGCARCHDHKYDPFSQREYYELFAFFDGDVEANIPAPQPGEEEEFRKRKAEYDNKLADFQARIDDYRKTQQPAAQADWEAGLKLSDVRMFPAAVQTALLVEPAKRDAAQAKAVADQYAKINPLLVELNKELAEHQKTAPELTQAQTLALGPPRKTHLMIRGDFLRPGVEVTPDAPAVLPPLAKPKDGRLTRLDLARWLVGPDNPLTARVAVNWMWSKYFGRGLVATPEDFGTQGEKPSHPELLDWLATELVRQKWDQKAMHKLIVCSATYRQSSKARPDLAQRDPLNVLLARQARTRLEAEILRDEALASSGLLVEKIGGPSVRPPQPAGISELTYAGSASWVESVGPDRYRRGMYTWFQRTSPYPMLTTFDAPDANLACVRRDRTNTPLQALTLLNNTVFVECAQALGRRMMREEKGGTEARLRYGFRLCVSREPTAGEQERLAKLYADLLALCKADPEKTAKLAGPNVPAGTDAAEAAAWMATARALLNLDEYVTRE
jgi:mono/diheme cytochrome c family protein